MSSSSCAAPAPRVVLGQGLADFLESLLKRILFLLSLPASLLGLLDGVLAPVEVGLLARQSRPFSPRRLPEAFQFLLIADQFPLLLLELAAQICFKVRQFRQALLAGPFDAVRLAQTLLKLHLVVPERRLFGRPGFALLLDGRHQVGQIGLGRLFRVLAGRRLGLKHCQERGPGPLFPGGPARRLAGSGTALSEHPSMRTARPGPLGGFARSWLCCCRVSPCTRTSFSLRASSWLRRIKFCSWR